MNPSLIDTPALSRRGLLKFSLGASAFLTTVGLGASLSGCSPNQPASGLAALRDSDLAFLRAVIPVMLNGAVAAEKMPAAAAATLQNLDISLAHLSPAMLKLTRQLFDVLTLGITRGPLTGVWGSWENASTDDIRKFLERWENSALDLLRQGHSSLLQLVMMAWYSRAEAWAHCGYPGPPKI
ncbi:twin-arginine translocation pathway signal protein [Pseudomonas fluorescens]|uniref:twin-arginine translocation pathway signal protein n=1 Tax=Pseudomonas fluorescens TaxID=294 RepID=UPI001BECC3E8|nr:twin-arginine translocation pathway signal protein [Pseudomonas fluorescens]MBT2296849.1 twin-arginine translocation pathway signal protein [Pseudomonas fluorescens]MBT2307911.1 twin-arginine translocation pathway signal protein [Pseudomonas fluorescens]MBT2313011.1 twin-arginine translocation pathway signal protein [Pseudomonas fluorescens]MBT2317438.1 twin-arginine translocation pathway signal protein [Pseudomonas fluorescens]MBT2343652.1 twin-arginine translocation pathway signal protein